MELNRDEDLNRSKAQAPESKRPMPLVDKIAFGCAGFAIVAALVGGYLAYAVTQIVDNLDAAYAQWGAADMVIGYMYENDDRWPPDWEALRDSFDRGGGRMGGTSFEEFQQIVEIDFDVDVEELRRQAKASDSVPFNVIRPRSFWGSQMGDGPNAQIYRYLRSDDAGGPAAFDPAVDDNWIHNQEVRERVEKERAERRLEKEAAPERVDQASQ